MKKMYLNAQHNIVGAYIKILRKNSGYSQAQLAARVQTRGIALTQDAISRIESGQRIVTDYELQALAQGLNVTIDSLFSGQRPGLD